MTALSAFFIMAASKGLDETAFGFEWGKETTDDSIGCHFDSVGNLPIAFGCRFLFFVKHQIQYSNLTKLERLKCFRKFKPSLY
jgi:hypothetical protein